jgi:hypothetical protein
VFFSLPVATANALAFDVAGTLISNAPCTGCQQPTTCNATPAWSRDHVSHRPTCCGVAVSMTVCKTVRDIRLLYTRSSIRALTYINAPELKRVRWAEIANPVLAH